MAKIAIYTCIIGQYDSLEQPLVTDPDFDYICFVAPTADPGQDGVWKKIPLPQMYGNDRMTSRYPKMHPHILLQDYEYSVWMDGNVRITGASFYDDVRRAVASGVVYAGARHPFRDCIYAEAWKVWRIGRMSLCELFRVWTFLFMHGYPRHAGLMECAVIFRKHYEPCVISMDSLWWRMTNSLSHRDQASHMWCMKQCRVPVEYLFRDGYNIRNHPSLEYRHHIGRKEA